jgi:hypothetical protein
MAVKQADGFPSSKPQQGLCRMLPVTGDLHPLPDGIKHGLNLLFVQ